MSNEERKEAAAMPDVNDDELWQELNQSLWLLVRNAAPSDFGESRPPDLPGGAAEALGTVPAKDARKKQCLSFVRCEEVAEAPASLTAVEKTHLDGCGYCERRIKAFSELLVPQTREAETPSEVPATRRAASLRERLVEQVSAFFARPLAVGFGFAALVLLAGTVGFFVFRRPPDVAGGRAPVPAPGAAGPDREESVRPNEGAAVTGPDKPPVESASNPNKPNRVGVEPKEASTPSPPSERQSALASIEADLRELPEASHQFVRAVLSSASASVPVSDELKSLSFKVGPFRSTSSKDAPKLLSPNRETTVEARPTFRWEGPPDASFQIIVRNERKDEKPVARAEGLTGTSWVAPENLPAGIYYWEVNAFDKEGKEIAHTPVEAIFKVVDKDEVERVKKGGASHLAKASYFIAVVLLDEAERELEAELKKNPDSRKARNMLRQVRAWQKQLRSN